MEIEKTAVELVNVSVTQSRAEIGTNKVSFKDRDSLKWLFNFGGEIMVKNERIKINLLFFLGGVFCCLALFILTGATNQVPKGKYELGVVTRERTVQMYVIDTSTGAVKWVDSMNTPFIELKGD